MAMIAMRVLVVAGVYFGVRAVMAVVVGGLGVRGHGLGLRESLVGGHGGRPGQSRTQVLDVRDGLLEQLAYVVVVQLIEDATTLAGSDD
jgi:hypothetical protein